jgi:hypothetical protein
MFAGLQDAATRLDRRIDALVDTHWRANHVAPAPPADDATFMRRVMLDLTGRLPTVEEARAFLQDHSADKRKRLIQRLLAGPEYPLQKGRILDDILQGKYAGDSAFLEYLRRAAVEHRPWDRIFREIVLGPWDNPACQGADRFLLKRVKSLDDLATDTARVFFGVDVSCAKCHDHPLVADWTQDRYYGMAAFFNPTYEGSKTRGGGPVRAIREKSAGDVTFVTTRGQPHKAPLMFLSGRIVPEPVVQVAALTSASGKVGGTDGFVSRRELLVNAALQDRTFFSRAIVNRLWAYFLGQGLVQPVDQMHAANPPSVPGLLEALADDLATHGYDLDRLVAGIISSRVYQLASTKAGANDGTADRLCAQAQLRPLTPHQYALSLLLATQEATYRPEARQYRDAEARATRLVRVELLDPRSDRFQTSTAEALYLSNQPELQRALAASGKNLTARLAALPDAGQAVDLAVWTLLSHPPAAEERTYLAHWLDAHAAGRSQACAELVWALATSAEFRFNH